MTTIRFLFLIALFAAGEWLSSTGSATELQVRSPDGKVVLHFSASAEMVPVYSIVYDQVAVIEHSSLGFRFRELAPLGPGLTVVASTPKTVREEWKPVVGQSARVENHYNELAIDLAETGTKPRKMQIIFRVFDGGVGFRYHLPEQPNLSEFAITAEETRFAFAGDYSAWWIPANYDSDEDHYRNTPLSAMPGANTPVTFEVNPNLFMAVHEAALVDYANMTLRKVSGQTFASDLVPWPDGEVRVVGRTPAQTPWRVILLGRQPGDLIESNVVLNLNPPSSVADTSWIKPLKYEGIWWSVHLGYETFQMGPHHAATTAKALRMIDWCKQLGVQGLLVEGWNAGWEFRGKRDDIPDFTQAAADYDLERVAAYAQAQGVDLILHTETFGNVPHFDRHMEQVFALCQRLGIRYIKGGYAGETRPIGTHLHSQPMVAHYRRLVEMAAAHQVMVDIHEPIKDTGWRRTYPNFMTSEGVKGMEANAWTSGNPPSHGVILPFTRLLAGPMDYNTGIFDLQFKQIRGLSFNWRRDTMVRYPRNPGPSVHTTLAKQLAQYVIFHSPMQMVPDIPENYAGHPAYQFIRDVPTTWDDTRVLAGRIGEYIVIARKGQGSDEWFIGGSTNERARSLDVDLSFLDESRDYVAYIYADGEGADWAAAPERFAITNRRVSACSSIQLDMAPGGGVAVVLRPAP